MGCRTDLFSIIITVILCSSAANKVNALARLKKYLNFSAKTALINRCVVSKFNYYPCVWMFSNAKFLGKTDCLHKGALRSVIAIIRLHMKFFF